MDNEWFTPLKYQSELLKQKEQENAAAHRLALELAMSGHTLTWQGKMVGPYTTVTQYYYSNGAVVTITSPSSLGWAYQGHIFPYC